jgi:5-hydroxyisourate hydrolase
MHTELRHGVGLLARTATNATARTDALLFAGAALTAGRSEEAFLVAEYFRAVGLALHDPPFHTVTPVTPLSKVSGRIA